MKLGIPFHNPEFHPWTGKEDELLGTMPDMEVAKRLGRTVVSVRKRRYVLAIPNRSPLHNHVWTKQIALLGTMSDREAAEQIGCPQYVVTFKRRSLRLGLRVQPLRYLRVGHSYLRLRHFNHKRK